MRFIPRCGALPPSDLPALPLAEGACSSVQGKVSASTTGCSLRMHVRQALKLRPSFSLYWLRYRCLFSKRSRTRNAS